MQENFILKCMVRESVCKETASLVCSSPVIADKEVSAGSGNGLDLTGFVGNNSQLGRVSLVVVVQH